MKSKRLTHHLLPALLGVAFTLTLHAQTSAFTYQGRLTDNGSPASGIYDLRFSIYDADTGGTEVAGPVINPPVAVSNGLFTVTLDFGASVFDGSDRWLEIGVATNGSGVFTNLNPRQPLTATPYAIQAANAASANSVSAANISGTIPLAQLPGAVVTNGASGVNISGTFSGNGAGVTNMNLLYANTQGTINFSVQHGGFVLSSSPGVGADPNELTSTDLNGDGHPDVISANYGGNRLTVLTNDGSGGLVQSSSPIVGNAPITVTAADVNGDGRMDLISANTQDNTLTVLTNDGSAGLMLSSSPGVGEFPASVTAADVNGNGKVDLISANYVGNTLSVLTNDGSGGFVLSSSLNVGATFTVVSADVNGDGHADLIRADYFGSALTLLTNDGSGGFTHSSSPGVGGRPRSVTSVDVNGDGHLDLISANITTHTLTVLTNDGSGGFALSSSPGAGSSPRSLTSADVNGDGHPDFVTANYLANRLTVLTNDGNGGFVLSASPGTGIRPIGVTAVDLNGDGLPDLVSANETDNTLTVLFNTASEVNAAFVGDGAGLTSLSASNMTGTLGSAQIPNLDASKITSGVFNTARIPDLDASKTTSGTFTAARIPGLDASQLATGTLDPDRVPGLDASKIGTGTLDPARIPSLDASKIATGTLDDARFSASVALLNRNPQTFTGANDFSGNVGIGTSGSQAKLDVRSTGPSLFLGAPGGAQGQKAVLGLWSTFENSGDNGQRRTADILAGFNAGTWGNEYLAFHVGNNGAANDGAALTSEKMRIQANGNVGIGTSSPSEALEVVGNIVASGTVTGSSDRNVKENFAPVDPQEVLEQVSAMPIQRWNYIGEEVPHIGPVAQDFHGAFQVGMDDKHISMVDADGVALAAIQGLNQKLEQKETEITELKARLEKLEQLSNKKLSGGPK